MDKKNVMKAMSLCGTGSETCTGCPYYGMNGCDRHMCDDALALLKANAIPTEYDILACVEKYSYDSFSDFCAEFGYSTDSISARETFLACGEEYAGLRRIFTEEQMEKMREIN